MVTTHTLGYPRVGAQRQLKFALEAYWAGRAPRATWQQRNEVLKALLDRGWGERLMIGHDGWAAVWLKPGQADPTANYFTYNPDGMLFISKVAIPGMREIGITQEQIDLVTREVPRRFLAGE